MRALALGIAFLSVPAIAFDADLVGALVPFGVPGLAIVSVVIIAVTPSRTGRVGVAVGAMVLIGIMMIVASLKPLDYLLPANPKDSTVAAPSGSVGGMYWVDTGTLGDWGGRDWAHTAGSIPKYEVGGTKLCDENHGAYIATCWDSRPSGYAPDVKVIDFKRDDKPSQWCTYKDATVTLAVRPDGGAPRGRVYVCGRSIPHR